MKFLIIVAGILCCITSARSQIIELTSIVTGIDHRGGGYNPYDYFMSGDDELYLPDFQASLSSTTAISWTIKASEGMVFEISAANLIEYTYLQFQYAGWSGPSFTIGRGYAIPVSVSFAGFQDPPLAWNFLTETLPWAPEALLVRGAMRFSAPQGANLRFTSITLAFDLSSLANLDLPSVYYTGGAGSVFVGISYNSLPPPDADSPVSLVAVPEPSACTIVICAVVFLVSILRGHGNGVGPEWH